jgi:hypothetical protein
MKLAVLSQQLAKLRMELAAIGTLVVAEHDKSYVGSFGSNLRGDTIAFNLRERRGERLPQSRSRLPRASHDEGNQPQVMPAMDCCLRAFLLRYSIAAPLHRTMQLSITQLL